MRQGVDHGLSRFVERGIVVGRLAVAGQIDQVHAVAS
jgi:hypothetical protein